MTLTRLSISLEKELADQFDAKIDAEGAPTRSKAIGDLIRSHLLESTWQSGENVAGAVILVYDHHKRDIAGRLTEIQHGYLDGIISTQHIHLDHHHCLEIIAVRGRPRRLMALVRELKGIKGLKHVTIAAATTDAGL